MISQRVARSHRRRVDISSGRGLPGYEGIRYDLRWKGAGLPDRTFTNGQVLNYQHGCLDGSLTVVDSGAGTVKVVSNQLEITGSGTWDETGLRETSGVTRSAGKALLGKLTHNTDAASLFGFNTAAGIVRANGMEFEFDVSDNLTVVADDASASHIVVGTVVDDTEYKLLCLLGGYGSANGIQYFIKGGTFSTWTLLWTASTDSTATLYPFAQTLEANSVYYDDFFVPTNALSTSTMFMPNFYDTFAGTNDDQLVSAHTPEVVAGATGTGNPWESGSTTWTIQSNAANNNPGTTEIITLQNNRDFSSGTIGNWEKTSDGSGTLAYNTDSIGGADDKQALVTAAGDESYIFAELDTSRCTAMTQGTVYRIRLNAYVPAANTLKTVVLRCRGITNDPTTNFRTLSGDTWTEVTAYIIAGSDVTGYAVTTGFGAAPTAGDKFYFDDISVTKITLNEEFATDDLGITQGIFDVDVTIPSTDDGYAGMVLCLDSESSPANYLRVAYNRMLGKVELSKIVAGTYTSLISTTTTYAAGATLRAVVDYVSGTDDVKVSVYYNGALIGSQQTIEDNGIAGNTRHGIMSVDSSNSLDNFTVHNRTDSNWDTEISNATGSVY